MWHAGGERWAKWYPAVRDELVARQQADGSWILVLLRPRLRHGHVPDRPADARQPVADFPEVMAWEAVSDQWSVVSGQRSVVSSQYTAVVSGTPSSLPGW